MPLGCDEEGTEVVSAKSGNNWRPPVVWTDETRPICGAGSLDSLTRAALPREFAGKGDGKSLTLRVSPNAEEEGMAGKVKDEILHDHNHDGINRRGFLKCMSWAGPVAFCVMKCGVLKPDRFTRLAGI